MQVKEWTYEDFPDFTEELDGVVRIKTTGEEVGVDYIKDVEYACMGDMKLHLQMLLPYTRKEPNKSYPCIVFVQGSAWMKQDLYSRCAMRERLAMRGYVVAIVEYRDSSIAPFPAQVIDTQNAIRFLRIHGDEYRIDTKNIIVAGDSSGGQVAMFCGLLNEVENENENLYPQSSSRVNGILDYFGAVSMLEEDSFPSTLNHHLPDSPEGMLLGKTDLRQNPSLREAASVECYINEELKMPPVCIFHGTKDRTVNVQQSVSLYQKLKSYDKLAVLYLLEGADHGGAEFWTDEVCDIADAFIKINCLK